MSRQRPEVTKPQSFSSGPSSVLNLQIWKQILKVTSSSTSSPQPALHHIPGSGSSHPCWNISNDVAATHHFPEQPCPLSVLGLFLSSVGLTFDICHDSYQGAAAMKSWAP